MDGGDEDAASRADRSGLPPVPTSADAAVIVDDAVARYCASRRERLTAFVDRHYSFRGALRVHGQAFGWDLLRAPANLALALPQLALLSAGLAGRTAARRLDVRRAVRVERLAHWLTHRNLFLRTDVAAEVEWLLYTDLLELPYRQVHPTQGERIHTRDAIAEAILDDPRVDGALRASVMAIGHRARDPGFHARLADVVAVYVGSRVAASDIATSLVSIGVGALTARQFTPGMLTLGPAVAGAIAKHTAIASFPLGAGVGGLWYGAFPVTAGPLLVAGVTGGLFMTAASVTAFAGILADPVQRKFGIHRRRLSKLLRTIERELTNKGPMSLTLRDHYAARLLDLFDLLRSAQRLAQ